MYSLISINNKFMEIAPNALVSMIKKSKTTKGLEVCIDVDSPSEVDYLDALIPEVKAANLILQIHGDSELSLDKQLHFLKKLTSYSDILGYKMVVTLHPLADANTKQSKQKTIDYLTKIIKSIDSQKIVICLENLNQVPGYYRLGKEPVMSIVRRINSLCLTYDLGHELMDTGGTISAPRRDTISLIQNVHIHTNDRHGNDHQPIYENDPNWPILSQTLSCLKSKGYSHNLVFEYDLYCCQGKDIKEKVSDYLSSIDLASSF